MAKKLTPISIASVRPRQGRAEIPDGGCAGLYLVVQPSGVKSFAVRYRFHGQPRKLTLGTVRALSLADARAKAAAALRKLGQDIDPAIEKRRDRETTEAAQRKAAADTIEAQVALFIERYAKRQNRSWKQAQRTFDRVVLPEWRGRTIHDIAKRDVINLAEAIAQDRPILANRTLSHVRKLFNWLVARDVLKANPCLGVVPPGKEVRRDRVLDNSEIMSLWTACDDLDASGVGEAFGAIAKLLLLSGQRRSEVAYLPWSEIDAGKRMWSLPGERTKNGKPHNVPLSRQALAILDKVPCIAGSPFVFAIPRGFGSYTTAKRRVDERMPPTKHWTFHDLRRTCATGMADIGIPPHIIEAVLNHVSGHKSGVAGIYNRAVYAAEKADAMQRWADHVERIVTGKPAGVVALRSAQSW
jgi:integrase